MSTVTTRVHTASPMENGEVRCFWHPADPLPRRISHTSKNPDRAFYSCEVVSDGPTGATCKFFKWEDELQPVKSRPPSQGAVTSQSSPQTPSKRPASTPEHELSPQQKRLNSSQQTPTSSPQRAAASQTRLAAMLRAQGKLPAESEASSTLQSPSGAHQSVSPSASSSRPTATTQSSPLLPSWCSPKTSSTSFQPMTPPSHGGADGTPLASPNASISISTGSRSAIRGR
ncbi:hypothetical protein MVEN_00509500 [Mycena venus]|uniref:GRF-type domain-containing protein n=1 Tax=Mycena venus TaxID=2733690 RepID=A0A8H7D7G9_9AGAR|nr:hypothetical protein MVEN_00509500 [Mycena venus]